MTLSLAIRPLAPADAADAARIWHEGWHDGHASFAPPDLVVTRTAEHFAGRIEGVTDGWVLEADGRVAGFAFLEGAEIAHFYVDRAFRGTGAAARFIGGLERVFRDRGLRRASLECGHLNHRARRFYESVGWVDVRGPFDSPATMDDGTVVSRIVHTFERILVPGPLAVRPVEPAETEVVVALWHQGWHDAHARLVVPDLVAERTPETFASRLHGFGPDALVALADGAIVGFAALKGDKIDQFYVARRARGTGLASTFMNVLEGILRDRGTHVATLEAADGNDRACRFYAKVGWTDTGAADRKVWTADGRDVFFRTHVFTKRLG